MDGWINGEGMKHNLQNIWNCKFQPYKFNPEGRYQEFLTYASKLMYDVFTQDFVGKVGVEGVCGVGPSPA